MPSQREITERVGDSIFLCNMLHGEIAQRYGDDAKLMALPMCNIPLNEQGSFFHEKIGFIAYNQELITLDRSYEFSMKAPRGKQTKMSDLDDDCKLVVNTYDVLIEDTNPNVAKFGRWAAVQGLQKVALDHITKMLDTYYLSDAQQHIDVFLQGAIYTRKHNQRTLWTKRWGENEEVVFQHQLRAEVSAALLENRRYKMAVDELCSGFFTLS